jgi:spore coat polysaccharide biosynthesis predicted glycosyltransferase SpsG
LSIAFIVGRGKKVGLGHLKRCISIALELEAMNYEVNFLDGTNTGRNVDSNGKKYDLLVLDKYDVNEKKLRFYKKQCRMLVRLDDASPIIQDRISDVIINGNPYGAEELYEGLVRKECYVFAGPEFIPMDKRFCDARNRYRIRKKVREITITFGGTDDSYAYLICRRIMAKRLAPHLTLLNGEKLAKRFSSVDREKISLLSIVEDVQRVFLKSDIVICSSGSTCWQLAAMGVPYVAFQRADNQSLAFRYICDSNIAIALEDAAINDGTLEQTLASMDNRTRRMMSKKSRGIVDCRGAARIARILKRLAL